MSCGPIIDGMDVRIAVASGTEEDLRSLHDWLRHDDLLRHAVRREYRPRAGGELGTTLLDAVQVAVASGGAITVLAGSLAVWFRQPRRSNVKFEITVSEDETRIVLDATNVKDAEALLDRAIRLADPTPSAGLDDV